MSDPKTRKRGSVALLADLMARKASEYTVADIQMLLDWSEAEYFPVGTTETIEQWAKEAGISLEEKLP